MNYIKEISSKNKKYDIISKTFMTLLVITIISIIIYLNYPQKETYSIYLTYLGTNNEIDIITNTNIEEILEDNNIELDSNSYVQLNDNYLELDKLSSYIPLEKDSLKVEIVDIYEVTEIQDINYETIRKDDNTILKGEEKTEQKGVNGSLEITYEIKELDNEVISKNQIEQNVIIDPVDEVILVGTKEEVEEVVTENIEIEDDNYTISTTEEKPVQTVTEEQVEEVAPEEDCIITINGIQQSCN